jgi:ABC-type transport system involved in multi-copper enzyme maturation permease subunit
MEKRLIIIDKGKSSLLETYLRSVFFLLLGIIVFSIISYCSFNIIKNIHGNKKGDITLLEDTTLIRTNFNPTKQINVSGKKEVIKDLMLSKQIEDLQNSPLFVRFEDIIIIYSGIIIAVIAFIRKKKEIQEQEGGLDER